MPIVLASNASVGADTGSSLNITRPITDNVQTQTITFTHETVIDGGDTMSGDDRLCTRPAASRSNLAGGSVGARFSTL